MIKIVINKSRQEKSNIYSNFTVILNIKEQIYAALFFYNSQNLEFNFQVRKITHEVLILTGKVAGFLLEVLYRGTKDYLHSKWK